MDKIARSCYEKTFVNRNKIINPIIYRTWTGSYFFPSATHLNQRPKEKLQKKYDKTQMGCIRVMWRRTGMKKNGRQYGKIGSPFLTSHVTPPKKTCLNCEIIQKARGATQRFPPRAQPSWACSWDTSGANLRDWSPSWRIMKTCYPIPLPYSSLKDSSSKRPRTLI